MGTLPLLFFTLSFLCESTKKRVGFVISTEGRNLGEITSALVLVFREPLGNGPHAVANAEQDQQMFFPGGVYDSVLWGGQNPPRGSFRNQFSGFVFINAMSLRETLLRREIGQ